MAIQNSGDRGTWNSKLGFILAAAGSAVGLGNIWAFPNKVASNGGAAFLVVYLLCCLLVGLPVMIAELSIGRKTAKNPVGAFRSLMGGRTTPAILIGFWGLTCGVMILAFYNVVAGWTAGFIFEEIFQFFGKPDLANLFSDLGNGHKNAVFAAVFMVCTISIVAGGVSEGIERATKTMMPLLIGILVLLIGYVIFQDGAGEGLARYLKPDLSQITTETVLNALGQSFFSLSLGMGALITYGSYLNRDQNIPEAAAWVTLADIMVAFLAGLLVMPAMFVAQHRGIQIMDDQGRLLESTGLVFNVLPQLFHGLGAMGLLLGVLFFVLLGIAALTSTISLLEVLVSYLIDERGMNRKTAAISSGLLIGTISIVVAYDTSLIDLMANVFNNIGLPLGGLMICLFVGYVWGTPQALSEMRDGFKSIGSSLFGKIWPFFIRFICPVLILLVFLNTLGLI